MAKETSSNGSEKSLVADWAKAQKKVEEAQDALEAAQRAAQSYSRRIYEAFGTEPFAVKELGRSYRAIHKKAGKNEKTGRTWAEAYHVIPLPDFAPTRSF